jgi:hypothetical protein
VKSTGKSSPQQFLLKTYFSPWDETPKSWHSLIRKEEIFVKII